mgnify:CR=1 FL=1
MNRYIPYALHNIVQLEDDFCKYHVQDNIYNQDNRWDQHRLREVRVCIFDDAHEAERFLWRCAAYDRFWAEDTLRGFLCEAGLKRYPLHRMDTDRVIRAAAEQLVFCRYRLAIEPKTARPVRAEAEAAEESY